MRLDGVVLFPLRSCMADLLGHVQALIVIDMRSIPESDWKVFRDLHGTLMEWADKPSSL